MSLANAQIVPGGDAGRLRTQPVAFESSRDAVPFGACCHYSWLTTIVRPTYSMYSRFSNEATHSSIGDPVSSSVTTIVPGLVISKPTRHSTDADRRFLDEIAASDEALMDRLPQGDKEALVGLFRRYARIVRGVAFRILRDAAEADDLVQDVFLFIHRKGQLFDASRCSARSWIVQITYHRAIDRRRYLQSRLFYTRLELNGATELPEPLSGAVQGNDFRAELTGNKTLQGLLDTLTEDQRNTLTLHFVEGFTFAEIGAKLDQSVGNIRNHYYRGLEKLRRQMFPGKSPGRNGCDKK